MKSLTDFLLELLLALDCFKLRDFSLEVPRLGTAKYYGKQETSFYTGCLALQFKQVI